MEGKRESVGGLWIRTAKSGTEYFSLSINGENFVAFANKYKSGNQPDYRIFASEERPASQSPSKRDEPKSQDDQEIPF